MPMPIGPGMPGPYRVAHALLRCAAAKRREESRRGTHECVRHSYATAGCGACCLCLHSGLGHCHMAPALSHFSSM